MGLCYSINREHRALSKATCQGKRTFNGKTLLARVVRVYDGDTIFIETRLSSKEPLYEYSLRLTGVDAPEIKPQKDCPHRELHKKAAVVSKDFVQGLCLDQIVQIEFQKEEKYGRLLGTVYTLKKGCLGFGSYRKDVNVTEELLRRKLALPYGGGAKYTFDQEFLSNILRSVGQEIPSNSLYPTVF